MYGEYTMLLEHVKSVTVDEELEAEYIALVEEMDSVINQMKMILEAPMDAATDRLAGEDQPAPMADDMQDGQMPAPGKVEGGNTMDDVMAAMDTVMQQMEAAKRGLGLVNKLADSPARTTNRSRVMGNMNRIRANIRRIEKMLSSQIDQDPEMRAEIDYDARSMAGK